MKQLWQRIHLWGLKNSAPEAFERLSQRLLLWIKPLAWLCLVVACVWGLLFTPMDSLQKNSFRIIYIHVPSAATSLSIYVMIAMASLVYFVWNVKIAAIFARAAAPYGALMTALALITGAIWGKPTWGTYWTWDARLTSQLVLLFLYLAYMLLQSSLDDRAYADKLASILAVVGVVNIPIIHYSVVWWNSLHQGATLFKLDKPSIAPEMLYPLLIALLAFYLLFFTFVLQQMKNLMLQQRIQRYLENESSAM
ncbi:MAG: heme ABC transporter permease CcmC [Cardiobacteriaceae bacterium]|nr:heme ABC transporter permease CcmC [Cardiobacteriaceae bacterium]